jgi:hypothetical protein
MTPFAQKNSNEDFFFLGTSGFFRDLQSLDIQNIIW